MGNGRSLAPAAHLFLAGSRPLAGLVSRESVVVGTGIQVVGVTPALGVGGGVGKRDGGDIAGAGVAPGTAVGQGGDLTLLFPVERWRVDFEANPGHQFSIAAVGRTVTVVGTTGRRCGQAAGVGGDFPPHGLFPPPFLLRKLKNAVDADPSDPGFPLRQPALLGGDKAAENAAFPRIDGIIPFIAVFASLPGFGLGKGIGLVNAAIQGLAPVFGQGFQDGGFPVLMGKGLPVGAVPGDGAGLG